MELDPEVPPYSTADANSFASISARDRWPVIITGAIDDVHRTVGQAQDEETRREGKKIVEELAALKHELQHDRILSPIPDDGQSDIAGYNEELSHLGIVSWHNVPWLFSECYMYRRISTSFSMSKKWRHYDIFSRQKLATFKSSQNAVLELAARYKDIIVQLENKSRQTNSAEDDAKAEEVLFTEMCEICLWGNATDLSLLTNLSYEDIQKLQGSSARKAAEKNIVVNDLPAAFATLKDWQSSKSSRECRVDIILDNAGFELFVDLILAGYLLSSGLATTIVLHPKSIPWFVSDVIPQDFTALLNALADPQDFYNSLSEHTAGAEKGESHAKAMSEEEVSNLQFLFQNWSQLHQEGKLIIRPNRYWTRAGGYWRMPKEAPDLLADLREAELVIFKGDLNYRKLTNDVQWSATTPFAEAIGPLARKGDGIRVLALRTCKADVVVGLPQGEDERLRAMEGGGGTSGKRRWAWSGKWALVQYHDGKGSE